MSDPDQILIIVSMVPYCAQNAQKLLGHFLDLKQKLIESRLMSIEILT